MMFVKNLLTLSRAKDSMLKISMMMQVSFEPFLSFSISLILSEMSLNLS